MKAWLCGGISLRSGCERQGDREGDRGWVLPAQCWKCWLGEGEGEGARASGSTGKTEECHSHVTHLSVQLISDQMQVTFSCARPRGRGLAGRGVAWRGAEGIISSTP